MHSLAALSVAGSLSVVPLLASDEAGPERLKERSHVTVETNAPTPVTGAATNAPVRRFHWDFSWQGWDGLHFDLTR